VMPFYAFLNDALSLCMITLLENTSLTTIVSKLLVIENGRSHPQGLKHVAAYFLQQNKNLVANQTQVWSLLFLHLIFSVLTAPLTNLISPLR
jgi:hypothetical protein